MKRAEAIRVADPLFDYWRYDSNNDWTITSDELLIIAVFADNVTSYNPQPSEDQHPGHPQLTNSIWRAGGNVRPTNPSQVEVDHGPFGMHHDVCQHIAGVGEIAYVGVVAHEVAHPMLGLGDLYESRPDPPAVWLKVVDG